MTKIFVAGATGYIGINVVKSALNQNFEVVAASRKESADFDLRDQNLTVIKITESDDSWLAKLQDIDVVISCLASRSGEPKDAHNVDFKLNKLILEKAKAIDCSQFILLSAICVQKPKLAFQFEKLAFEEILINSGLNFSIIRPTAYFKSLSGQIENIKKGKPYVYFGDGKLTQCNPISEKDLSLFILSCIRDKNKWKKILPIGGPNQSLTPKNVGEMLFKIFEVAPKYRSFPTKILDVIGLFFLIGSPFSNWAKNKLELIKIAKYYATESMLVWDEGKMCYDHFKPPSTVNDTLEQYFYAIKKQKVELNIDRDSKLY